MPAIAFPTPPPGSPTGVGRCVKNDTERPPAPFETTSQRSEASGAAHVGALAGLALVLFGLALVLNAAARLLVRLVARGAGAAA